MKRILSCLVLVFIAASSARAQFHDNGIFRESVSFPVQMVVPGVTPVTPLFTTTNVLWKVTLSLKVSMVVVGVGADYDVIARKTLTGNDLVNLALGRPLGTKVDAKKEVLALDVLLGTPIPPQMGATPFPTSRLVIYDTTAAQQDDTAIVKVLGENTALDWQTAYGGKTTDAGFGLTTGTIKANGTSENGISESTLYAAGTGAYAHTAKTIPSTASAAGALALEGHLTFVYTDSKGTHNFDGIVTSGSGRVSGKPLGFYSTAGFAVASGMKKGTVAKKTVKGNDLVNLALGRPLGSKVDSKTEVLAVNATFETHGQPPESQLVIYDSTKNGSAGISQVLAEYGTLDFQNAYKSSTNSGFGVSTGKLAASGTSQNGLSESPFQGVGSASGKHLFIVKDEHASPVATGIIQGHLKFQYTDAAGTHNFDGIYIKGTGRVSGKPIGGF